MSKVHRFGCDCYQCQRIEMAKSFMNDPSPPTVTEQGGDGGVFPWRYDLENMPKDGTRFAIWPTNGKPVFGRFRKAGGNWCRDDGHSYHASLIVAWCIPPDPTKEPQK